MCPDWDDEKKGWPRRRKGYLRLRLVMGYYNLCLPHQSLREALSKPIPTKGNGSPKKWIPRTSAVAAGITDHEWTMGEFLLFRVPPWRQEVTADQGEVRHQGENEGLSALLSRMERAQGRLRVAKRDILDLSGALSWV